MSAILISRYTYCWIFASSLAASAKEFSKLQQKEPRLMLDNRISRTRHTWLMLFIRYDTIR